MGQHTELSSTPTSEVSPISPVASPSEVTKLFRYDCLGGCCPSRWAKFPDQGSEQQSLEASVLSDPIVHRHVFQGTSWQTESFTVNDPAMRAQLNVALDGYQDFDPELKSWGFSPPYEPLVHRLNNIEALILSADDAEGRNAMLLFMKFLRPILRPSIESVSKTKETGKVLFEDVWHIFPPGEVVLTKFYSVEAAARVVRYEKKRDRLGTPTWEVELEYVDWNGGQSGYAKTTVAVGFFSGYKFVTSLAAYPLSFCPDEQEIRERLTARGRDFERLRGYHFRKGLGTKILLETEKPEERPVNGRVIVDSFAYFSSNNIVKPELRSLNETAGDQGAEKSSRSQPLRRGLIPPPKTYERTRKVRQVSPDSGLYVDGQEVRHLPQFPGQVKTHTRLRYVPDDANANSEEGITEISDGALMTAVTPGSKHTRKEDLEPLSEYECLLATPWVRGLDLKSKDWALFNISELSEIEWNDDAFDRLVLPGNEKDLAWQFVENKRLASNTFDDFIADKGRGIIILMFGPPGVGKTFTAEAVSERARVPLYAISAASLGTEPADVETALERALELCRLWGAMLLLDEADIFLAARTDADIARNELVAVFLTKLEYYQGVCFLTTNRIKSLDHAFQSRIDLFLPYADLTPASRRQVWENFIDRAGGRAKFEVTEEGLEKLAQIQVNGREIKNLIKSAHLLSLKDGGTISLGHLQTLAENRNRALQALAL